MFTLSFRWFALFRCGPPLSKERTGTAECDTHTHEQWMLIVWCQVNGDDLLPQFCSVDCHSRSCQLPKWTPPTSNPPKCVIFRGGFDSFRLLTIITFWVVLCHVIYVERSCDGITPHCHGGVELFQLNLSSNSVEIFIFSKKNTLKWHKIKRTKYHKIRSCNC